MRMRFILGTNDIGLLFFIWELITIIKGMTEMTQMTAFSEKSSGRKKIGDIVIFFLSPEGFKTLGH